MGDNRELFTFYLEHGYNGETIIKAFKNRQISLKNHLNWMARYVNNTKLCRRQMILEYFGEQLAKPQVPCCDITDETLLQRFEKNDDSQTKHIHSIIKLNWQERLYQLFNINHNKEN